MSYCWIVERKPSSINYAVFTNTHGNLTNVPSQTIGILISIYFIKESVLVNNMSLLAFYDVYICIYYTFITISTYTTMIIIFKRLAKWDKWSHSSCGNKMKQTVLSNLLPLLDWRDVKGTSVESSLWWWGKWYREEKK